MLRQFQTHNVWRKSIEKHEKALAEVAKERETIVEGDGSTLGLRQRQLELQRLIGGRGRVWKNVRHGVPDATGKIRVAPENVDPKVATTALAPGTQVFVFAQAADNDPGAYLGDFSVGAWGGNECELQPIRTDGSSCRVSHAAE